MTNAEFAKTNIIFISACDCLANSLGVDRSFETTRQASKYRNKKGSVFTYYKFNRFIVNQKIIDNSM